MAQTMMLVRQADGSVRKMTQRELLNRALPTPRQQEFSREDKLKLAEERQHRMFWLRFYIDG